MDIPRRDVDFRFDPQDVPRDWASGDPFITTFMNALSLLFPEGERFFVDAVKQHKEYVTDPELAKQVIGFIGQEAMHGKEHRAFNELLVAHGYTQTPAIEAGLRSFLKLVRKVLSPKSQLAATCALEHFTAMLAEKLLTTERMRDELDPRVRLLWTWHALEENEHKAVAYDVYVAANGGYVRRVSIMALASVIFWIYLGVVHARLMRTRKILWKPWTWVNGAGRMFVKPGYFSSLTFIYLSYYLPRFHPNDRDTSALLESWRSELFGARGALSGRVLRVVA